MEGEGVLSPEKHQPGRCFAVTTTGVHEVGPADPQRASDAIAYFHPLLETLFFGLSLARGSFVPILDVHLVAGVGERIYQQWMRGPDIVIPRSESEIFGTSDELEAFMRQAFPKLLDHARSQDAVKSALMYLTRAFDEEMVEVQYSHAWLALEILAGWYHDEADAADDNTGEKWLVTRSKFQKWVRPEVVEALDRVAGKDSAVAEKIDEMKEKIPELNRPTIVRIVLNLLDAYGQQTAKHEVEHFKRIRDRIMHGGTATVLPTPISHDEHDQYRNEVTENSWRLIRLLQRVFVSMLVDEPLRGQLLAHLTDSSGA
jgi:hypothetical protein